MAAAPTSYNPAGTARSMVNAQFNPAIASLRNLLAGLTNQDQFNQQQIGGWYGQMQNLMNSQQAQQGADTQQQIANLGQNMGNVAQLFGANNAQQMQPAFGNAAGLLSAVGQSNQDYLSNMVPLLAAQAAQATSNEQTAANAQRRNYSDQLQAQLAAKGAAYNSAYQQAVSNHTTDLQNQEALSVAKAMAPYQISAAKSTAAADAANAAAAPAYNAAKVAAAQAQAGHYVAMTAKDRALANKALQQAKSTGVLAPGSTTQARVAKALTASLYSTEGKHPIIMADPTMAQKSIAQQAIADGLINPDGSEKVKGAVRMLNGILASTYRRTPGWQKNYLWNAKTGHFSKRNSRNLGP